MGKAKGGKKGTETVQNVNLGERGKTTSCALKEAKIES